MAVCMIESLRGCAHLLNHPGTCYRWSWPTW